MSQDKELEIQLQFLEEAQEYLDTIESVLLDLAGNQIGGQKMDAVLRAAHSVKGGAGMMGYQTLSGLAHRLEDSFKVLKVQRNSIEFDAELESLLLMAVDRLRQVLSLNRQQSDVDPQWLETQGYPVFEKLHERLGDPVEEDASSMLGPEEGTNVAALLFETEVEGCLNRLDSVLADPQAPCLEEELSIMAQELEGLGEMLQLPAFSSLCQSVIQHLEATPEQVKEIAQLALQSWRRSQALVLVGQLNSLPTILEGLGDVSASVSQSASSPTPTEVVEEDWTPTTEAAEEDWTLIEAAEEDWTPTTEAAEEDWTLTEVAEEDWTPTEALDESWQDLEVLAAAFETSAETVGQVEQDTAAEFETSAETAGQVEQSTEDDVFEQELVASASSASLSRKVPSERSETLANDNAAWAAPGVANSTPVGAKKRKEAKSDTSSTRSAESQENTVRIPVRQLDRLGDLFGELTIERNGLSLHLERLRSLMETLRSRVSTLEQSNQRLRTTYDKVATQANTIPAAVKSLAAAIAPNGGETPPANYNQAWANYSYSDLLENPSRTGLFNTPNAGVGEGTAALEPGEGEGELGDDAESINNGFDALEMDQYSDLHLLSMEVMETIVQIQEVTSDIDLGLEDTDQTTRELNRTSKQLQTNLTRLRMRPLSDLVGRFSRALRDLSFQHGKQVELKVVGKSTLIDRSILETLSDPLMHLVRNAFDHGIETPEVRRTQGKPPQGTIEIKAAHRGNQTLITISDDGNGIKLDKIRSRAEDMGLDAELLSSASEDDLLSLIFEPGFSTADQVTDLSGRGVGMDVVRNNLRQIRGDIRVDTSPGRGTTFTLTVPFTLSVARILLVESNGMLLAFPTDVIEEMLLLLPEQILKTPGSEALQWEGEIIPLIRLGTLLKFNCPRRVTTLEGLPSISDPTVMMINQDDQLVGLQVDRCWGEREVAIRKVEGTLTLPSGFSSCAILGDGKVVPLVDSSELVRSITNRDGLTQNNGVDFQNQLTLGGQNRQAFMPSADFAEQVPTAALPGSLPQARTPSIPSLPASVGNPPEELASQSQKRTILVVDDSVNVRRFLALALEKAGYLVEQAKDGQDAVEKLLSGLQVQAVICDIEMPRLDGYGFLARIKSDPAFKDLPIAMLTSRSGEKHRQLAMTLGATAYFSKPYNERVLLQTLEQLTLPKN